MPARQSPQASVDGSEVPVIDAVRFYGPEADNDPFRQDFERARALLDTDEWERGLDELEALDQAGSALSKLCIAGCLVKGFGYDKDLTGAEARYRVAADAGYSAGLFGLGIVHLQTGRFVEAFEEFERAVSRDYHLAYHALACLYARGEGVEKDRRKALALWRAGAAKGHRAAKIAMIQALIQGYAGWGGRIEGARQGFRFVLETVNDEPVSAPPKGLDAFENTPFPMSGPH